MPKFIRTANIAAELDTVQAMQPPGMPGWFSQMDEIVLRIIHAYPQLTDAHQSFSAARFSIGPRRLTTASWESMQNAARELAEAVRSLGDIAIELCERKTSYGTCHVALLPNGECSHPNPNRHTS